LLFSLITFDKSTQQKTFEELGNHTNSFKTTSEGLQKKSRQNRNKKQVWLLETRPQNESSKARSKA
jgi:hypothetical protein